MMRSACGPGQPGLCDHSHRLRQLHLCPERPAPGSGGLPAEALPRRGAGGRRCSSCSRRMEAEGAGPPPPCRRGRRGTRASMSSRRWITSASTTGDQDISVGEHRPAAWGMSEGHLSHLFTQGDRLHPAQLPHPLPHPQGHGAAAGLPHQRCTRWPSGWAIGTSPTSPPPSKK